MAEYDTDKPKTPKAKGLSDAQLEAILAQQIALAKHHDKHEREGDRSKAIDYYLGDMDKYVPPEPNRSKVVSRDVADTIGWTLPQIMRAFLSSSRMAMAEPVGLEDEEWAKQATAGLNHVFLKDNDGEDVVYDATWDALLIGNAPIKTYYDDTPVYTTSFHSGLTEDQVAGLLQGDDVEVLAHSETESEMPDPETGEPVPVLLHDLKIKRKKADGTFCVEAIPPEDFLIDKDAITTDEAAFTAHRDRKTRSDLVAMGYDKEKVFAIPEAGRADTAEEIARNIESDGEATDTSMELVDYFECFVRIDVDDDGEAELIRACYAGSSDGGTLLDWEVWEDEHPFDDIKCEPIPHRWSARSQADETMDIQDIKTVLSRQLLNNTYWVNNPQRFVQGKIKNPEELTSPSFGGAVFGDAGSAITDLVVPYIGDKALLALTHFDEVRQARTGVGRQSMALDPDLLQNQTATASNNNKDASYTQVEQYVRNMASGWRKVFRKLLKLMIKHQTYSRKIMWNGKEVVIDPRFWDADMDVTVNTGLGTGSRDRDLAMLGQVLQTQILLADRFMAAGANEDAIELLPKILMTMTKMAESAGIRNPEDFYPEYTEEKVGKLKELAAAKAQQGDPKVAADAAKAQADQQIQQQKLQGDMQMAQAKMQMDGQRSQAQMQQDAQRAEMELQVKREQLAAEMALKREQLQAELMLKREQMAAELQLKRELGHEANSVKAASATTSGVHMGGDPG